jgi:hypothetical protein
MIMLRKAIITTISLFVLAGCRSPGLPTEPPEADAANPDAGVVEARAQANPFTRSAFEGVKLDGGGGHEHHHHGHGAKQAPAPAEGSNEPDEHAGHGGRS